MSEADRKGLKVKTGSVNRLAKELRMYTEDEVKQTQRVASMKTSGADSHDIKHAENVLAEATMIIPDTRQRLEAAYHELQALLAEGDKELLDSSEGTEAQQAISQHAAAIDGGGG